MGKPGLASEELVLPRESDPQPLTAGPRLHGLEIHGTTGLNGPDDGFVQGVVALDAPQGIEPHDHVRLDHDELGVALLGAVELSKGAEQLRTTMHTSRSTHPSVHVPSDAMHEVFGMSPQDLGTVFGDEDVVASIQDHGSIANLETYLFHRHLLSCD